MCSASRTPKAAKRPSQRAKEAFLRPSTNMIEILGNRILQENVTVHKKLSSQHREIEGSPYCKTKHLLSS